MVLVSMDPELQCARMICLLEAVTPADYENTFIQGKNRLHLLLRVV